MSSLASADWDRFTRHAQRVRRIAWARDADLPVDLAALVQMLYGPRSLLPNIKTLSWKFIEKKNFTSIHPFIGPQLKILHLIMDQIDGPEQSLLLQSLLHRIPTLTKLWIASFALVRHMNTNLASFIISLPKLVYLYLPGFSLTKEVVAAAAKLPELQVLDHTEWIQPEETYEESGTCFEFTPGSFPKLVTLSFGSLPARMAEILQATDHVGRLRTINLDCPAYFSTQEIKTVFANLAAGARDLNDVQLLCCPVRQLKGSSSNESLSIDTIRPLFSCTGITRFHLLAPHFEPLKDGDVVEMGASWPRIGSLTLCPSPLVKREMGTRFDILPIFAKSFPNLRELRLFFGKEVAEFDGDLYPAHQFMMLQILGVGLSPAPKGHAHDTGFLLASLCQKPPSIEFGVIVSHRGGSITEQQKADMEAGYSEVRSIMNLAFRVKASVTRKFDTVGSGGQ